MRDQRSVHETAKGRWPVILAALGAPEPILNVRKHHPCPWCGGKDRFRFTNKDDSGSFICGQCGHHSPVDYLMQQRGWDFQTAAKEVEKIVGTVPATMTAKKKDMSKMRDLWSTSLPITKGDVVDAFFNLRGIDMSRFPASLRKLEKAEHVNDEGRKTYWPAMVARISSPDGEGTNVHRTYLTPQGSKAPVDEPRKMMAGGIGPGSSVKLYAPQETMGIAEGIETSLSATLLFRMPVWSALNTSMLKTWEPPEVAKKIVIYGDNDSNGAGQAAAYTLVGRLKSKGLEVSVEIPPNPDEDWNDVLMARMGIPA